ncbi:hypothetical protein [Bradyrhizobium sp. CB3481]|uniref:hypothetical protein n=1 Tax=Bradyrhizobium sp. CB3481 TaxID=3039158 RepID=UPI0024B0BAD6|nr:hypothetical protein [Bradyrhizobium sp. CB3481]WFU20118.1 hypothetical protein QA643_18190 [Bradyrhizobium sp. CB3481]
MKGHEVGADGRDLGKDRHHPVVGGKGRLDGGDAGLVGGEGVSQRGRWGFDRELDHGNDHKVLPQYFLAEAPVSFS